MNNPIHSNDRVYDPEGISPTLNTMQGGLRQPFILSDSGLHREKQLRDIAPPLRANTGEDIMILSLVLNQDVVIRPKAVPES